MKKGARAKSAQAAPSGGAFLAVAALALTGIFKCIRRIRFV